MNPRRLGEVFRQEFMLNLKRPMFWVLILIVGFMALMMSKGNAQIGSGSAAVGGSKAWITSEFAMAQLFALFLAVVYAFFIAVGAGMSVIRDEELKVGEMLHATPLTPAEYVWGKFLAVVASFLAVIGVHLALMVLFNHGMPHGENVEVIGPFVLGNYLLPVLLFALPMLLCTAGGAFAIGTLTRMPILVFALPIVNILLGMTILWDWSPAWLDPSINRLLMVVDPTAIRWLNETWLKVDRGVDFYNHAHVGLDPIFWINRLLVTGFGLGLVVLTERRFGALLRGKRAAKRGKPSAAGASAAFEAPAEHGRLSPLAMRSGAPGFFAGAREVARVELRELRTHPGLYLFVPMILIQTLGSVVGVGAFDSPLLHTPGTLAVSTMNTLTLLVCMLLLFYTVESLQRERGTGFGSIYYATPLRTGGMLLGKAVANTVVALLVLTAALVGNAVVLAVQGKVPFRLEPFLLVWGLLLTPTFLVWTTFVMAVFALTRDRYATYALGIGAMALTGFMQVRDKMNWAFNWDLWSATRWSDISVFELDRLPLILNRIEVLGLAAFFIALTVRLFPRIEADATRIVHRMRPAALAKAALRLSPLAVVPLGVGIALWLQVQQGFEGAHAKKQAKDYWKQNTATWAYAPVPAMAGVDVDVALDPARGSFTVSGSYRLINPNPETLKQFPITGGAAWDSLKWRLNGAAYKPEDHSRLYVFTPEKPLATGDTARVGFSYSGRYPNGISKNGNGPMEFLLPSSAVFTAFSGPTLLPQLGFMSDIGPEQKDRLEPRGYPDDEYRKILPTFAVAEMSYNTRIRVTVPADFRANSNGVLESDVIANGKRTQVWVTDHPIKLFNLVAGRWKEKRGPGVTIYYYPSHTYNLDEMMEALVGARRWYSEWFAPYPWRDLRLSEFPALATYAQGPPSNITFSEGIGFLTKSEPKANAAFWVTAHEAAHQWWGNMLTPAERPGGEVLSEGMAHFSTILLTEQVKGPEQRMAFCREIETRYARRRHADAERALTRIDGSRQGDGQIIYDKGGYAAYMMMQLIGRERMLAGLQEFIALYRENLDHPVLQDYLAVLRRHAPDSTAFDAFAKQWYFDVVVPEYRLSDARAVKSGSGWDVSARIRNAGTGEMPVVVAAVRGERFAEAKEKKEPYRDARTTVVLGPKQEKQVVIHCQFEPERVMADPDLMVLQLERSKATTKVEIGKAGAVAIR